MKLLFKMQTPNRCVRELNCLTSPRILCVCVCGVCGVCGVCVQEVVEVWGVAVGMCDVLLGGYLDQIHSME